MQKLSPLLLLVLGGTFITIGDIWMKKWSLEEGAVFYVFAMISYVIGLALFAMTLRSQNLAIASLILVTANNITLILVSYFYFKDKFTLLQVVGIILSLIAVVLLEWED